MPTGFLKRQGGLATYDLFGHLLAWIGRIPAFFFIGLWFLPQVKSGFLSLKPEDLNVSVIAYWAHIGGFGAGAVSILPFIKR